MVPSRFRSVRAVPREPVKVTQRGGRKTPSLPNTDRNITEEKLTWSACNITDPIRDLRASRVTLDRSTL